MLIHKHLSNTECELGLHLLGPASQKNITFISMWLEIQKNEQNADILGQ